MIEWIAGVAILIGGVFLLPRAAGASLPPLSNIINAQPRISEVDLDTLARTIWGEARGEGREGMKAVANVVLNRYQQAQGSISKARQFGATISEICRKPYQFSVWNSNDPNYSLVLSVTNADPQYREALEVARAALNGNLSDNTGGADHYHTAAVNPSWSQGETPVAVINSHRFFRLV